MKRERLAGGWEIGKYTSHYISSIDQHKTFHEHFHNITQLEPNVILFTFLDDNGNEQLKLSASELDKCAKCVASHLINSCGVKVGDRVILLCNPGYDFIVSFFGCMYSGAIAVPCYPPMTEKHTRKLFEIGNDCNVENLILSHDFYKIIKNDINELEKEFGRTGLNWISLGDVNMNSNPEWNPPKLDRNSICFLQYTSGLYL